jgi:hypothetical protein
MGECKLDALVSNQEGSPAADKSAVLAPVPERRPKSLRRCHHPERSGEQDDQGSAKCRAADHPERLGERDDLGSARCQEAAHRARSDDLADIQEVSSPRLEADHQARSDAMANPARAKFPEAAHQGR